MRVLQTTLILIQLPKAVEIITKSVPMIFEKLNKLIADPFGWPRAGSLTHGAHDGCGRPVFAGRVQIMRVRNVVESSRSASSLGEVEPAISQHRHSPHQAVDANL